MPSMPSGPRATAAVRAARRRNAVVFGCVVAAWLALDVATKAAAEGLERGTLAGSLVPGVVDVRLVHNTGGAWGLFGDMTVALGVLSLAVCAAGLRRQWGRRSGSGSYSRGAWAMPSTASSAATWWTSSTRRSSTFPCSTWLT